MTSMRKAKISKEEDDFNALYGNLDNCAFDDDCKETDRCHNMADNIQEEINHHDIKQWQHCSLFNLDLFNDEHHNLSINKDIINNINIDECCCSLSTLNVDDQLRKKHLNHSCPFAVLQKNYTTQLEHVAEKLLANNENNTLNNCSYCLTYETNDTKVQSINRKILLGSTVILDNFLRNSLKTSLLTNSNNPPLTTTNINLTSTIINGNNNPRRWHSERGSRHPNVRVNLPLTTAQRQVLERYMNYPVIKPSTNIRSAHRSHHQPITGKVVENTGTALSTLTEQPLNTTLHIHLTLLIWTFSDDIDSFSLLLLLLLSLLIESSFDLLCTIVSTKKQCR
ncbi:unnamed protein product [Rotaria sp. Silwood1]|nr:unnamed protein product [Rotaria sp. Silwood1]